MEENSLQQTLTLQMFGYYSTLQGRDMQARGVGVFPFEDLCRAVDPLPRNAPVLGSRGWDSLQPLVPP